MQQCLKSLTIYQSLYQYCSPLSPTIWPNCQQLHFWKCRSFWVLCILRARCPLTFNPCPSSPFSTTGWTKRLIQGNVHYFGWHFLRHCSLRFPSSAVFLSFYLQRDWFTGLRSVDHHLAQLRLCLWKVFLTYWSLLYYRRSQTQEVVNNLDYS